MRENHPEQKTGERRRTEPFSGGWEEKTAQSKHSDNIPVATVSPSNYLRGATGSCQGALALVGEVPVSL